jgi:hypothetical protein
MGVDMQEQLTAQLAVVATQGVANNQQLSQNTLLAYQKDLFQGGQGESPALMAALSTADRTPVIKVEK